jgi:zinc finger CCHC domain-containing protein 9
MSLYSYHRELLTDANQRTAVVGTGRAAGADEDDFHTVGRAQIEVEREEKGVARAQQRADLKIGALSGTMRAFGTAPTTAPKKVVMF